jgi:hypothetical protein
LLGSPDRISPAPQPLGDFDRSQSFTATEQDLRAPRHPILRRTGTQIASQDLEVLGVEHQRLGMTTAHAVRPPCLA